MNIDRCYCFDKTFEELKAVAYQYNLHSINELQEEVDFGLKCHLCHPYINEMLRTGETAFDHIVEDVPENNSE